ncbi:sulfotransferase family protein [Paenibacillus kribbensis]|uniref:sulfotransferase-like domain-containing protein n=1 Tax=Paenibacillus kribbensis TaxID=172713 RepID=UPI0015C04F6B|nr:sulfotransferase family protein [Paenibacillus kribbensis]
MINSKVKTIWLWGVPRSISTAFGKTFSQRNDCELIHEPFAECYYFSGNRKSFRYGENPNLVSYGMEDIEKIILEKKRPVVFLKDLAFQAYHYVNDGFLSRNEQTFIIRHPLSVFSSLKKLKPDFTEEEFGFTAFQSIWDKVSFMLGHAPVLVEGERFQREPERILREYCKKVGLDFQTNMLSWDTGMLREWTAEDYEVHTKWHKTLEQSKTINPPRITELDLNMSMEQKNIIDNAIEIYNKILPYAL